MIYSNLRVHAQTFCKMGLRFASSRPAHTVIMDYKMNDMTVKVIPVLKDNYMYLIIDRKTRLAGVVDPVDPVAVMKAAREAKAKLTHVMITHHHADHSSGSEKLLQMQIKKYNRPLDIFGNDDRNPGQIFKAEHGRCFTIGKLMVGCVATPCHTTGAVCYFVRTQQDRAVFTGDTLFQGGCGSFLEGTPEQMYEALYDKLGTLPFDTKVFCGHELTLDNLKYAQLVEPNNEAITKRILQVQELRRLRAPSVPSTIAQERSWNPFMRVHKSFVQRYAKARDPITTMARLRREKDKYKM